MIILEHESEGVSCRTLALFTRRVQQAIGMQGEVDIRIAGNRELQDLNRRFRKKNKPTDVLSFPSDIEGVDGDIAISADIATTNAAALGHTLSTELKVLILHGLLHLAGYDHELDKGEMLAREAELRRQFRLPVGLIERAGGAERPATVAVRKSTRAQPARRSRKR